MRNAHVRSVAADGGIAAAVGAGAAATLLLAVSYATLVRAVSESTAHLLDQMRTDRYLLVPIMVGFGIQVGLLTQLRRRRFLRRTGVAAASVGTGTSAVGMIACCAHHLADLVPFLGVSAVAPFLYRTRAPLMLLGLTVNVAGIVVAYRRLRGMPTHHRPQEEVVHCGDR